MLKVSVIIPCLNMERYISDCLNSVRGQTLGEIEILVIDAGSTDGTLDIVNKLSDEDERIYIVHSEQKSYGYQVNLGIARAKGEYIAIVDADDRIAPTMYEVLYENASCSNADYVKGTANTFYTISSDRKYYRAIKQFKSEEYSEGKISLIPRERPELLEKDGFLWYGIFKREFMKNIRLHESPGAAFQDLGGLLQTQMKAKSAIYLKESFYEYRQDNLGASGYNPKGFKFVWEEYNWAEQFIRDATNAWKSEFYRKMFLHTLDRYYAMSTSGQFWDGAETYIKMIRNKLRNVKEKKIMALEHFTEDEKESFQMFLEDDYSVYYKYLRIYAEKKNQLETVLKAVRDRKIVIFGVGMYGKYIHAQLLKQGQHNVVCYCDNSTDIQGKRMWDVLIRKPADAVDIYPDACFIIANYKHCDEMKMQLMRMGVSIDQICRYTAGPDMRLLGETL